MSIKHTYIFDNENDVTYDDTKIEVVTTIDDPTNEDPFVSGTVSTDGADAVVDGNYTSGYVTTTSGFIFIASGEAYAAPSGEIVTFDFGDSRQLNSVNVYQNNDNYAVEYMMYVLEGSSWTEVIAVSGAVSGNISHNLSKPVETSGFKYVVNKINPNLNEYHILEIDGDAGMPYAETAISVVDVESLNATSVVEPVENLYDSSANTFWQSNNSYPQEVIWKFDEQKTISKFEYTAEDASTYPTAFTLSVSTDGETYTDVVTETAVSSQTYTKTLTQTYPAVYVKWNITSGVGAKVRIREAIIYEKAYATKDYNEIRLKKTVVDALPLAPGLAASSESGSNVASNMIVGNSGYWQTANIFTYESGTVSYTGSAMVTVSFTDAERTIDKFVMDFDATGRPVDFVLSGSDDNVTYTALKTITGNAQDGCVMDFSQLTHTYKFYKVTFTKSTHAFIRVDSMQLQTRSYPQTAYTTLSEVQIDSINSVAETVSNTSVTNMTKYILVVNDVDKWFNGTGWVTSNGTFNQANAISDINNNVDTFTFDRDSKIKIKVLFYSDTKDTSVLNEFEINSVNLPNLPHTPENQIRITGYIAGYVNKPVEMQIHLRRQMIVIDGQTIAYGLKKIYSNSNGYFDFTLPVTENASPPKARFVVKVPSLNIRRERHTPARSTMELADWLAGGF